MLEKYLELMAAANLICRVNIPMYDFPNSNYIEKLYVVPAMYLDFMEMGLLPDNIVPSNTLLHSFIQSLD